MFLAGGFAAEGEIRMMGARLEANLSLAGASVSNPGGTAVNLNRSRIGIVNAPDAIFDGEVSFTGAQIASDLKLAGAQLRGGSGRPALRGPRPRNWSSRPRRRSRARWISATAASVFSATTRATGLLSSASMA